jgi:hypothetical protein
MENAGYGAMNFERSVRAKALAHRGPSARWSDSVVENSDRPFEPTEGLIFLSQGTVTTFRCLSVLCRHIAVLLSLSARLYLTTLIAWMFPIGFSILASSLNPMISGFTVLFADGISR